MSFTVVDDNNIKQIKELVKDFDLRFSSGNSVPVKSIQLTKERWENEIKPLLESVIR